MASTFGAQPALIVGFQLIIPNHHTSSEFQEAFITVSGVMSANAVKGWKMDLYHNFDKISEMGKSLSPKKEVIQSACEEMPSGVQSDLMFVVEVSAMSALTKYGATELNKVPNGNGVDGSIFDKEDQYGFISASFDHTNSVSVGPNLYMNGLMFRPKDD
ncbi:hypothetical protein VNO77_02987 [Canavalia gladiata]|uniref:Uncharacterized protein n=1 Tax=Canavalia gladiata TaxID=3824 RepID=A0AAN9R6J5_CANGL